MNGEAVAPGGSGAVGSTEVGRENAYNAFCLDGFPCAAREMNRVSGLTSGAS
jgi:hypothetical protein